MLGWCRIRNPVIPKHLDQRGRRAHAATKGVNGGTAARTTQFNQPDLTRHKRVVATALPKPFKKKTSNK